MGQGRPSQLPRSQQRIRQTVRGDDVLYADQLSVQGQRGVRSCRLRLRAELHDLRRRAQVHGFQQLHRGRRRQGVKQVRRLPLRDRLHARRFVGLHGVCGPAGGRLRLRSGRDAAEGQPARRCGGGHFLLRRHLAADVGGLQGQGCHRRRAHPRRQDGHRCGRIRLGAGAAGRPVRLGGHDRRLECRFVCANLPLEGCGREVADIRRRNF